MAPFQADQSSAVTDRQREFYERGERAWQEYLRTWMAVPADAVFDRVDALFAERLAELKVPGSGGV